MTKRLLVIAAAALVLATGLANASLISFQDTRIVTTVGTATPISLPQFNPTLGTLTSVTVYVYGTGKADFAADNDYNDSILATASMEHTFNVTSADVNVSGHDLWSDSKTLTASGPVPALDVFDPSNPGTDGYNWGTHQEGENLYGTDVIGPSSMSFYQGTGNVNFNINADVFVSQVLGSNPAWYDLPGHPNDFYFQPYVSNPSLAVRVKVDYGYDPAENIPEPSTLALLGIGMCGLIIKRRRRAASTD